MSVVSTVNDQIIFNVVFKSSAVSVLNDESIFNIVL